MKTEKENGQPLQRRDWSASKAKTAWFMDEKQRAGTRKRARYGRNSELSSRGGQGNGLALDREQVTEPAQLAQSEESRWSDGVDREAASRGGIGRRANRSQEQRCSVREHQSEGRR